MARTERRNYRDEWAGLPPAEVHVRDSLTSARRVIDGLNLDED